MSGCHRIRDTIIELHGQVHSRFSIGYLSNTGCTELFVLNYAAVMGEALLTERRRNAVSTSRGSVGRPSPCARVGLGTRVVVRGGSYDHRPATPASTRGSGTRPGRVLRTGRAAAAPCRRVRHLPGLAEGIATGATPRT